MIQGKWFAPGSDTAPVPEIREKVFGRGTDALDAESWNVAVFDEDLPVACGRIRWAEGAFILEDIGVLPDYRGRRIGDLVLRLLLFKAQSHSARLVRLECPSDTAGFFARLGFEAVSESDSHSEMTLPGNQIDLDTCKSCKKQDCPNRQ